MMSVAVIAGAAFFCFCAAVPSTTSASDLRSPLTFPKGFKWGVAQSAFQAEGGGGNDWSRWAQCGGVPMNRNGNGYYQRFEEDHALSAQELSARYFRTSLEWSRIEPREGVFDDREIDHYREVLTSIRRHGMTPVLALWHFTNPVWFADQGGWAGAHAVEQFGAYVRKVVKALGNAVDTWAPFNEPVQYLTMRYLFNWGSMPGGAAVYDLRAFRAALSHMAHAHAQAYDIIKAACPSATVALINAISPAVPNDSDNPAAVEAAWRFDRVYNQLFANAVIRGQLDLTGLGRAEVPIDEHLRGKVDVFGVNYYFRVAVKPLPFALSLPFFTALPCHRGPWQRLAGATGQRGANGSEIDPPGIYDSIKMVSQYHLPIEITENGVSSLDGGLRAAFIVAHLRQVHRAIQDGYDVRGYFYWSPVDNYEWDRGFSEHFGLLFVDPRDPQKTRQANEGSRIFGAIARANAIGPELLATFQSQ
jgi:beta-glucosidase